MPDRITLSINNRAHLKLLQQSFDYVTTQCSVVHVENLNKAFSELLENVLFHAYKNSQKIDLHVNFLLSNTHIVIEVQESGMPFDFSRYLTENLAQKRDHSKGFYQIYDLVEYFTFKHLVNGSKCFTLTQPLHDLYRPISQQIFKERPNDLDIINKLTYTLFHNDDAQGITQLIYKNYDYTYYKSRFYDAQEILKANSSEEIISIVCKDHDLIIGHFALMPSVHSNIAEIGIAIVDPLYKQLGIMNRMFDTLIATAKEHAFSALYGEGMMIHPYSQKANLSHNMTESAILLGEVPSTMEIEHEIKDNERSGVVMAFLLFESHERRLALPKIYEAEICRIYERAHLKISPLLQSDRRSQKIHVYRKNLLNVATIVFQGDFEIKSFLPEFNQLLSEHCDMIFADIPLQELSEIDETVAQLNSYGFFYSGVLLNFYDKRDYLRLQRKNSTAIDEDHLICFSEDMKKLIKFIKEDEKRVLGLH